MGRKPIDPEKVALWRYEQIQDALSAVSREERGKILYRLSKTPVLWPSGDTRKISLATAYRWVDTYQTHGLCGLRPKPRKDRGTQRAALPQRVYEKAFSLWADNPDLTLTLLAALLKADPELEIEESTISHSTLSRRLRAHPRYATVQRSRKRTKSRRRFISRHPHEIWHVDAKGPVTIRLVCGEALIFHVLTVLDNASRSVLKALVCLSPDLGAAVCVFREAAKRWGLPGRLYADRASIFDSKAFRAGLAELGSHRIWVKSRNPEANGAIEAYHRCLVMWFTKQLTHQEVVDLVHLNQLLEAMVATVYQTHRHRGLRMPPQEALGGQVSSRTVATPRLENAFRIKLRKKAHPKTGEVDFAQGTYIVDEELRGQRLEFRIDPEQVHTPYVLHPGSGQETPLKRAHVRPQDLDAEQESESEKRWGRGPLQTLYDAWRGQKRPVAEPEFGLPEIFSLLENLVGRKVPGGDREAQKIQNAYREMGPFAKAPTEAAFLAMERTLGKQRPVTQYLDELKRVAQPKCNTKSDEYSS